MIWIICFFRKAKLTIDLNPENLLLVKFGNLFPFMIPLVRMILLSQMIFAYAFRKVAPAWLLPQIEELAPVWIINRAHQIIEARLSSQSNLNQAHPVDLLQLMLDASTKDQIKVEFSSYFSEILCFSYRIMMMMNQRN